MSFPKTASAFANVKIRRDQKHAFLKGPIWDKNIIRVFLTPCKKKRKRAL